MLLQGLNWKTENKKQELLRISQESGPEGIQRCGLKDYKKWLVWWDWPFKFKWQVARPPFHFEAMAPTQEMPSLHFTAKMGFTVVS